MQRDHEAGQGIWPTADGKFSPYGRSYSQRPDYISSILPER